MCHLVTWLPIPKSDAERLVPQMQMFVDDEDEGGESGKIKAITCAESLALAGSSRDIRLWSLVGEAKAKTITEWVDKDKING